jgi:hypothetical protein
LHLQASHAGIELKAGLWRELQEERGPALQPALNRMPDRRPRFRFLHRSASKAHACILAAEGFLRARPMEATPACSLTEKGQVHVGAGELKRTPLQCWQYVTV